MNLHEFEKLDENDRAAKWQQLSQSERDAILEEKRTRPAELKQPEGQAELSAAHSQSFAAHDSNSEVKVAFEGISKFQGAIIIVLLLAGLGMPVFSMLSPMQQWEYRIESPSDILFEATMNSYGKDGWELVTARRASDEGGAMTYECIFKRPKKWSNPR